VSLRLMQNLRVVENSVFIAASLAAWRWRSSVPT
jgi:hypothetical protein